MKRYLTALALAGAMIAGQPAFAQEDTARIALIHGLSGSPLEAYSKQTHTGFMLGLEYATKGTMEVKGKKIEIVEKDTQFKPDVARSVLAEAYGDDDVLLAVGGTSSGVTTAMLPIAAEYEKILLVEPAVADTLTGPDSNRYVFKTSRNSSMDMQAQALALKPDANLHVATLAQDYAFGRDGIAAFKKALEGSGATVEAEEYIPQQTTDFTATIERLFNALKDKEGRKVIVIYVAGIDAMTPLVSADPGRYGIEISTGGNILPALAGYKQVPGMEGAIYYYYPGSDASGLGMGASSGAVSNTELYIGGSWKFLSLKYSYATDDYFSLRGLSSTGPTNKSTRGTQYAELGANYELGDGWGVYAHIGTLSLKNVYDGDYTDWKLGVTKDISGWVLAASYIDTNASGSCSKGQFYCFSDSLSDNNGVLTTGSHTKDAGRGIAVVSVSRSF